MAKTIIAEWTEVFYNRQQLPSTIGYLFPVQFEDHYWSTLDRSVPLLSLLHFIQGKVNAHQKYHPIDLPENQNFDCWLKNIGSANIKFCGIIVSIDLITLILVTYKHFSKRDRPSRSPAELV
jgi:hypothetical protein